MDYGKALTSCGIVSSGLETFLPCYKIFICTILVLCAHVVTYTHSSQSFSLLLMPSCYTAE